MRWIDYYYSYEGSLIMRLGLEGVTYVRNPDGSFSMTDYVLRNPNGMSAPQAIGQYAIGFAGGLCVEFSREEFERARLPESTFIAYEVMRPFLNVKAMPILSFTPSEQDQLNPIIQDMVTYINESRVQFITGRLPLSQWDTYVRNIRNMGVERYVAIYQAAWDRFSR